MKISNTTNYEAIALDSLINKLSKQYDSLFFTELDNQLFIYRTINRKEYKDILKADMDTLDKQDEVCKLCILYPENFDIDNCDGGIPQQLYKEIIDKSCISIEDTIILLEMNRDEMSLLDNQMTCIIAEAFPSYKLEEIENMDMIQFTKLFSRAEWILTNFKNYNLDEDVIDLLSSSLQNKYSEPIEEDNHIETQNQASTENNKVTSNRAKMTPKQIKEYQEFCKKFPEFNMASDYAFTGDIGPGFDKRAPALRPGWGIPKK